MAQERILQRAVVGLPLLSSVSMLALIVAQDAALAQSPLPPITIGAAPATQPQSSSRPERGGRATSRNDEKKLDAIIGAPDTPSTEYTVDQQGMSITALGGASAIRAVANLPGVDAPAIDPYGVANLPGGNKGIRVRGELMGGGNSLGTVEGIPLSGINPGPGVNWLIDNENLSKIVLRQGPIASDVNSYFTIGGVIDSRLRWPEKKMGGEISQSVGSFNFLRTFARLDTGEFLNGTTKAFVSGTWTDADKWRGEGKSPQGKSGFAIGIETTPIDAFTAKIFAAKSSFDQHNYRGLTYQQASNLGLYRRFDFRSSRRIPYIFPSLAAQRKTSAGIAGRSMITASLGRRLSSRRSGKTAERELRIPEASHPERRSGMSRAATSAMATRR